VGCAYGLFLDEARARFDRVTGIDVTDVPLEHARNVLRLDARRGDFLTAELGPEPFDVVCMWDTIEHLPGPDRFVARAFALLRPGGSLFLTTGDIGALNARLRGPNWRQIHPPSHLNYFSRATMTRMLERVGFEVRPIETASYYHSVYNILASIRMRRGAGARAASALLGLLGERLARRLGLWINLGDTMFVAARRP
jgi:2-polyprenyl-3-methyl-5-hydroxy-6-metoxy-1,4-benzoquinol methylase